MNWSTCSKPLSRILTYVCFQFSVLLIVWLKAHITIKTKKVNMLSESHQNTEQNGGSFQRQPILIDITLLLCKRKLILRMHQPIPARAFYISLTFATYMSLVGNAGHRRRGIKLQIQEADRIPTELVQAFRDNYSCYEETL